jgi:hypothetical protein
VSGFAATAAGRWYMLTRTELLRVECYLHSASVSSQLHSEQRLQILKQIRAAKLSQSAAEQENALLNLLKVIAADYSNVPEPEHSGPILFDD